MLEEVISKDDLSRYFQVILVSPQDPLNIGSVLRAMRNLNFESLTLVAPRNFDVKKVAITACNASDGISRIRVVSTVSEAVSECSEVIGFTARTGRLRGETLILSEWCNGYSISSKARTGLLFGPEDSGLTLEDLAFCTHQVTIPAFSEYSSYNLAQAVLLALYHLRVIHHPVIYEESRFAPAPSSDLEQFDTLIDSVLWKVGFYKASTPTPIPRLVKRLFRRIKPDSRELSVLMGIFGRLDRRLTPRESSDRKLSE